MIYIIYENNNKNKLLKMIYIDDNYFKENKEYFENKNNDDIYIENKRIKIFIWFWKEKIL